MSSLVPGRHVPIARRQLQAKRGRTLAGIAGIAVALLLILALKAIFAGRESRLTAYISGSGADVIVAQEGVTTMHMTQSALASSTVAAVARVRGDRALADRLGVRVGDRVRVLGASLRVSGQISGTAAITGSFAFTARATLARILRIPGVASYVLVKAKSGVDAATLARRIATRVPHVSASTRAAFSTSERLLSETCRRTLSVG